MIRSFTQTLTLAALLVTAPALSFGQTSAPRGHSENYRDHTPRVHDRSPRPHGTNTPTARS